MFQGDAARERRQRTMTRLCLTIVVLAMSGPAHAQGLLVGANGETPRRAVTHLIVMRGDAGAVWTLATEVERAEEPVAFVVAVPASVRERHVGRGRRSALRSVERVSAPTLVELWERDPCVTAFTGSTGTGAPTGASRDTPLAPSAGTPRWFLSRPRELPRRLRERGFSLSDAGALAGAEQLLVVVSEARSDAGPRLVGPVRIEVAEGAPLPTLGTAGELWLSVLARERFEIAGRRTVPVQTRHELAAGAAAAFPEIYRALATRTLERSPDAVVLEHARSLGRCERCVRANELGALGADALYPDASNPSWARWSGLMGELVSTRMRLRTDGSPLQLQPGTPLAGGREMEAASTHGASPSSENWFVARFTIRHPWAGPIDCAAPARGGWSPVPSRLDEPSVPPVTTLDEAFPRGIPALDIPPAPPAPLVRREPPAPAADPSPPSARSGCRCHAGATGGTPILTMLALLLLATRARPRR